MSANHNFLFASLDSKPPTTARKVHIRRLYDILELCIQRNDFDRAKKAWCILIRCKEFRWEDHWRTGLFIINEGSVSTESTPQRVDYLRTMMLLDIDKEAMLKELVLLLIISGQYREAREELDLYIFSFPYQDNPVLHIYAGLLSLQLAQGQEDLGSCVWDNSFLRDAQSHFNQANSIDPSNAVVQAFLQKVYRQQYCALPICSYKLEINALQKRTDDNEHIDSDNESTLMSTSEATPRPKRVKI